MTHRTRAGQVTHPIAFLLLCQRPLEHLAAVACAAAVIANDRKIVTHAFGDLG